jgi:hypothetical protein
VCSGFGGALFESGKQAVGVAPVAFLGQDNHINQMGNASPEPEPKATDPVANLVAQDEVAFIGRAGRAAGILFLFEDLGEPRGEVLVLFHVANR